ncbi:hypothetical protein CAPTEDRAFT_223254 [Capitella teleta]|uniref:Prostamide/prostaglandin F synthase n=1 Tax=Capitella teleta TaxID=283909 RepID=R7UMR3_CAPTE|nr:hypothetical protein CAPTEDRAFT_223254 [Capitella teleta]|eukprot:ELU07388.1 hypothetical protein CAPTEDRAFT_223254 [Capitella teleta]
MVSKMAAVDLAKIGKNLVKCVSTGEMVPLESLWQDKACVLCRFYAKQLGALKPQLDANEVRLVGVGLEELGLEEFVEGKFWSGELYLDAKKQIYKDMSYKRIGFFSAIGSVLCKKGRSILALAKEQGITGNLAGDGYQNGGTIVVSKGGDKVLLNYIQESPADHVDPKDVLNSLGIKTEGASAE